MYKVSVINYDGTKAVYTFYNSSDVQYYIDNSNSTVKYWKVIRNGKDISYQFAGQSVVLEYGDVKGIIRGQSPYNYKLIQPYLQHGQAVYHG